MSTGEDGPREWQGQLVHSKSHRILLELVPKTQALHRMVTLLVLPGRRFLDIELVEAGHAATY